MIKVGITGQSGFIGTHLFNTLGLSPEQFERITFEENFFDNKKSLQEFVRQCDIIVHLAAMNRHSNPEVIYTTNINLVKQLIAACEITHSKPHILFSSSTQEEKDNLYGQSKKEGRELFEQWADKNQALFTGFVIPNVFGPFGNAYYNSVVATFCHQLTHGETPKVEVDGEMKLIYVGELVEIIIKKIKLHSATMSNCTVLQSRIVGTRCEKVFVPHTSEFKVSTLLQKMTDYKSSYFDKGIIPNLDDPFERNLFNTFVCYIDHSSFFPFKLMLNTDERGSFVELIKLNSGGQVSFSTSVQGITRGNHFHTRKAERFVVIKGKARIDIRRLGTDKLFSFELDGEQPSFVDMPTWFTHNITNIGDDELYTIFWINEHFNPADPDTFVEKV